MSIWSQAIVVCTVVTGLTSLGGLPPVAVAADPSPTLLRVEGIYLIRLQSAGNYGMVPGSSTDRYYRFSTKIPLPGQASKPVSWTISGKKVADLTRVGSGQCTDLVRNLTGTKPSQWRAIQSAVVDGKAANLMSGCVLATFTDGRYDSGHVMIYIRRVSDTEIEVADANWVTGLNQAMIVARHRVRVGGKGVADLKRYQVTGAIR